VRREKVRLEKVRRGEVRRGEVRRGQVRRVNPQAAAVHIPDTSGAGKNITKSPNQIFGNHSPAPRKSLRTVRTCLLGHNLPSWVI